MSCGIRFNICMKNDLEEIVGESPRGTLSRKKKICERGLDLENLELMDK